MGVPEVKKTSRNLRKPATDCVRRVHYAANMNEPPLDCLQGLSSSLRVPTQIISKCLGDALERSTGTTFVVVVAGMRRSILRYSFSIHGRP